jgi:hypothetical protein
VRLGRTRAGFLWWLVAYFAPCWPEPPIPLLRARGDAAYRFMILIGWASMLLVAAGLCIPPRMRGEGQERRQPPCQPGQGTVAGIAQLAFEGFEPQPIEMPVCLR